MIGGGTTCSQRKFLHFSWQAKPPTPTPSLSSMTFKLNELVQAFYSGCDLNGKKWKCWLKAKIININGNGTYNIKYQDGEEENDKKPTKIRKVIIFIFLKVLLSCCML